MSDRFIAIEAEYRTTSGLIVEKKTIEIGGKGHELRYGEIIEKDWKLLKILQERELPDSINDFFVYIFANSGYVIRNGLIYKEPFLVNMNILPGDKFFEVSVTKELLIKLFIAKNMKDLISCFSTFNLHVLSNIKLEADTLAYYTMTGTRIPGAHVIPYNVDTLDLYIEYLKYNNKNKNIKIFNTDESTEM